MIPRLVERVDCVVGDSIERAMSAHHRRRLRRVGWEHALSAAGADWVAAGEPPSAGNAIEVLVDGEEALPRMAEAIAGARSHVHIAGWCITPDFALTAGEPPVILRDLLADAARRVPVRVLLWGGAPLPLYPVSRRAVRDMRDALCKDSAIVCALDTHERPLHCHHEKLVIVDDDVAFVGGIDLTDFAGNRLDRPGHPPRGSLGWHDVATVLRGPAVAAVSRHFGLRWSEVTDERLPPPADASPGGRPGIQIVRTVPERIYKALPGASSRSSRATRARSAPRGTSSTSRTSSCGRPRSWRSCKRSCGIRRATASACCSCCRRSPTRAPTTPPVSSAVLADADDGAGRMLACTRYAVDDGASDRVYVHAKVGIVDDRWLTVGSANLNEHSLFNDTEMNVVSHDPRLRVRRGCASGPSTSRARPRRSRAIRRRSSTRSGVRSRAEQLERREAGAELTHGLVGLAHVSRRSKRLLGPLQSLLVDG